MSGRRRTAREIVDVLKTSEAGAKIAWLCQRHQIHEATLYRWKARYGGLSVSDVQRLLEPKRDDHELTIDRWLRRN